MTHSIFPGYVPSGFFDEENIQFISQKTTSTLRKEYQQDIIIDRGSIIRLMQRVLEERPEVIPKMNMRVIMYATNDYRNHYWEASKNLKYEAHYIESQSLFDSSTGRSSDLGMYKPNADYLGRERVGGTLRFYFTY
jgi:hypothetical protein